MLNPKRNPSTQTEITTYSKNIKLGRCPDIPMYPDDKAERVNERTSAYKNARINKCAHNKETSRFKIEIDTPITLMLVLMTCWKECGHALHHQLALAGGNEGALYFRTQLFSHLARTAPSFSPPQEFHLKSKILSIKQPTSKKKI